MGKPAARVGDMHLCPQEDPVTGVPHTGGVIKGPGCESVLIGGKPAAVTGDDCFCIGGIPDKITGGSTGVLIGGKPAARVGDECAHGGKVTCGFGSVLIGERGGGMLCKEDTSIEEKLIFGPEQEMIIDAAIKNCIILLEGKLQLLEKRDENTMRDFKQWFGWDNDGAIQLIINRIIRTIEFAKELTIHYFGIVEDEHERMESFAITYSNDEFCEIKLGDKFWMNGKLQKKIQATTLAHELSHFEGIGNTKDFDYGMEQCRYLARNSPSRALYNATSFEYFISG